MADLLSDEELERQLPDGWRRDGDEIVRRYAVEEYLRGVNFAQMIGEIAEARNHHPEIVVRYDEVEVRLSTHEAGGVTEVDLEMADLLETEWGA